MLDIDNKIYVFFIQNSKAILRFPKVCIETEAYIGLNGVTTKKKEGDLKTPIGEFKLGTTLGFHPEVNNKNGLKYKQITENMYWIDDFKSQYYNKLVDISKVKKDWDSAEHLIDYPIQYEYLIEIKTNPKNIPGKRKCNFFTLYKQ